MNKSSILALLLALFICGCNTVSLFYRNADWYLQHKIYGYTSFDDRQKALIRQDVADYMRWHRKNALPQYIVFLQNLNGAVQYQGQLKVTEAEMLRQNLLGLYQQSLAPAARPAAQLLVTLDSRQIQELDKNLAEEIREQLHEQYEADPKTYLDKRADRTVDFLEWLAGDLSAEQQRRVRDLSRSLPAVGGIYIRSRQANQRRLIALLERHADENEIAAFLTSWLYTPEATRSPQQQLAIDAFGDAADRMIVDIHALLTAKQKQHIHKMIATYIDDMRAENARESGK